MEESVEHNWSFISFKSDKEIRVFLMEIEIKKEKKKQ